MNRLVGDKNRGGAGHPKEKRENEWIRKAKNRERGGPTLKKKEITNGLVGA